VGQGPLDGDGDRARRRLLVNVGLYRAMSTQVLLDQRALWQQLRAAARRRPTQAVYREPECEARLELLERVLNERGVTV